MKRGPCQNLFMWSISCTSYLICATLKSHSFIVHRSYEENKLSDDRDYLLEVGMRYNMLISNATFLIFDLSYDSPHEYSKICL